MSKLVYIIFDCKTLFNADPNDDGNSDLLTPYEKSKVIQRDIVDWVLKVQSREQEFNSTK